MGKEKKPLLKPISHEDVDDLVRHLEDKIRRMRGDEPEPHKNDKKAEEEGRKEGD